MSPSVQKKKRTAGADDSEDVSEYKVDKIVNRRNRKGQLQYQIKWEGYPDSENTWENADQLDIPEMVAAFEKNREKTDDDDEEEEEDEDDDKDDDYEDEAPTMKKPRGRPSKTPSSAKTTPAKSSKDASKENGEKRGPGRPKKSNTPAKKYLQVNGDESDTSSVDRSASNESSARKRGRGRPPKTPTTEATTKAVSKSPLKAAQSPGKESLTKKTLFKESPAKKSAGSSAKPLKVVGLKLDGKSYQYIVKCEGESEPRKFSSAEAKKKFADLVVDYYEQTAVVSGIKIDPSIA